MLQKMKSKLIEGLVSPEWIWRIIVAIFMAGGIWTMLNHRVAQTERSLISVKAKLDVSLDELAQTKFMVNTINERTKRIENYFDRQLPDIRDKRAVSAVAPSYQSAGHQTEISPLHLSGDTSD